ncbi:hypothetical protein A374_17694 [Fictibacillus macauensis ZFHKF-1]|uniref:Lipoprotein n=1 Tax=Fictibacillus macauensis ZFHKF-1 TaxID=1196324 RepID=I8AE77_9BACL|nr:hypothetical protein [Fictibacillus macauensis]EIT83892.1 hypothetical protein A374_17694 [Fictibacillus macauensis ZFHKF-1]
MRINYVGIPLLALLLFMTGCSSSQKEPAMKLFDSETEAIAYGMKQSPQITEIIGESKYVDNEKILIYSFKNNNDIGIGTASMISKGNQVGWVLNGNGFTINPDANAVIKSHNGYKYDLYAGMTKNKNKTIETTTDEHVTPHMNRKTNIYYLLVPHPTKAD